MTVASPKATVAWADMVGDHHACSGPSRRPSPALRSRPVDMDGNSEALADQESRADRESSRSLTVASVFRICRIARVARFPVCAAAGIHWYNVEAQGLVEILRSSHAALLVRLVSASRQWQVAEVTSASRWMFGSEL